MHLEQFCTENKNYDHISNSAQERSFLPGPRKRLVKAVEESRSANSILRYMWKSRPKVGTLGLMEFQMATGRRVLEITP